MTQAPDVRLIAFYLPQYHPIPENDRWWGKGFTEWTNVTKAFPNFDGHYQPHLPIDLGFYDLRLPETRQEQADLARKYGLSGFCYYYYWFGGKRLLHRPLDEVLKTKEPDFPFCVCWANENWTRRWDGAEHEILIAQNHSTEDDINFINSLIPAFNDERYIRINGKPLLLVYRVKLLPNAKKTAEVWREVCHKAGVGDIYLCAVQSFDMRDPRPFGFDGAVEFPPHSTRVRGLDLLQVHVVNPAFQGHLYDYEDYVRNALNTPEVDYTLFRSVMPSWDNTARRQNNGHIFVNSNPENYEIWLSETIQQTKRIHSGDERIIFINAWNEWGEGCHLEPDTKYQYRFLEATRNALKSEDEWTIFDKNKHLTRELERTQAELERLQIRIAAMETSKFWKIRKAWFNVKRALRVTSQDA